jgi:hypothetical protein
LTFAPKFSVFVYTECHNQRKYLCIVH